MLVIWRTTNLWCKVYPVILYMLMSFCLKQCAIRTGLCGAFLVRGRWLNSFCPRARGLPSGEVVTPARRAARWGRLWGCATFILMPNPVLRALGRHRRRCRRAVRHENQSLTARQSRDLLQISGRVDVANTPQGPRPFCPHASPSKHPIRGASNFPSVARARVLCCGSYPPSLRSLR